MEKLKVERTSIQRRVSEAKEKGEEIEEKVEKWLVSAKCERHHCGQPNSLKMRSQRISAVSRA